jgi:hypothetical protein
VVELDALESGFPHPQFGLDPGWKAVVAAKSAASMDGEMFILMK